jgi:hypothetical protein
MNRRHRQSQFFSTPSEPAFRRGNGFMTWGAAVFLLVLFYIIGKVQVPFDLRDVEILRQSREVLRRQIETVRLDIHTMKSYERIVPKAKALGLVFVPVDRQVSLQVDMKGISRKSTSGPTELTYAGMGWIPRSRKTADRQGDSQP